MSLVIALKGKDCVVAASDSQVTSQSSGGPIKHVIKKIYIINDSVIFAATGTISLIQKSFTIVKQFRNELEKGASGKLIDSITNCLFPIIKKASDDFKAYHGTNEGAPSVDIILIAPDKKGEPTIWHIGKDGNDENFDEIGYICSGGADTFGYSIINSYYAHNLNVEKLILISYRTLKEATRINAYGLGEPIDVLVKRKGEKARMLSRGEMKKIEGVYVRWKMHDSVFLNTLKVKL